MEIKIIREINVSVTIKSIIASIEIYILSRSLGDIRIILLYGRRFLSTVPIAHKFPQTPTFTVSTYALANKYVSHIITSKNIRKNLSMF